jgi:hypothetical protein
VTGDAEQRGVGFPGAAGSPFEVSFVDAYGADRCERLAECRDVRFEDAQPVRLFPSFKGQRNFPCWWWSSTSGSSGPALASAFHEWWGWFAGWLAVGVRGGRVVASRGVGSRWWVVERVVGGLADAAHWCGPGDGRAKVPGVPVGSWGWVSVMSAAQRERRSRVNARASAVAHGQVACRRRMTRRAWRTTLAATCRSR